MYCPNCAAPIDGAKFCRSCGSNVSLVPQAMSGQLPQSEAPEGDLHFGVHRMDRRRRRKEPGIENAATSFFTGIGFVIAAIAVLLYAPAGAFWWWSFMIPAFATIGRGVGEYLRWKEQQRKQAFLERPVIQTAAYPIPQAIPQAPTTSELVKPSSVTEHTTRHLE
jgi:hypothetical protein